MDEAELDLGEKLLRFAVFFGEALGLEGFFSAVGAASGWAAHKRCSRLLWMASFANWAVICWKRFPFSRSWRNNSTCPAWI